MRSSPLISPTLDRCTICTPHAPSIASTSSHRMSGGVGLLKMSAKVLRCLARIAKKIISLVVLVQVPWLVCLRPFVTLPYGVYRAEADAWSPTAEESVPRDSRRHHGGRAGLEFVGDGLVPARIAALCPGSGRPQGSPLRGRSAVRRIRATARVNRDFRQSPVGPWAPAAPATGRGARNPQAV